VMAMYAIVMGGLTPAGSLIAGGLAQIWGAPGAFGMGGIVGLLAALGVWRWHRATSAAPVPIAGAGGDRADGPANLPDGGVSAGAAAADEE
jgi:hypothetical protein